jgi:DNA gyrase/topoisomerase IV subunit A
MFARGERVVRLATCRRHTRSPLIDGEGNLGAPDAWFKPADPPYTEMALTPLADVIVDPAPIREAYATGVGLFHVRPRFTVEEVESGGLRLLIGEDSYGVGMGDLLHSIAEQAAEGRLVGLKDLRHESGSPAVVTFADGLGLDDILVRLDDTAMRTPVTLRIAAVTEDGPVTLPLVDAMRAWIADRLTTTSEAVLKQRLRDLAARFGDERRTELAYPNRRAP